MNSTLLSRRLPKRWRWVVLPGVLVVAVVALWPRSSDDSVDDGSDETPVAAVPTAELTITDLTVETSFSGVLEYTDSRILNHRAAPVEAEAEPATAGAGPAAAAGSAPAGAEPEAATGEEEIETEVPEQSVLTATAQVGAVIDGGDELYRVNDVPIVMMIGPEPAWRTLDVGVEGADVAQLELNLVVLGFDPDELVTVDESYTATTTDMVKRWQESMGVEQTGIVALGSVVFLPQPIQVSEVMADQGATLSDGTSVLEVHQLSQQVVATASLEQRESLEVGGSADLTLPDRTTVAGTIWSIGPATAGGHEVIVVPDPNESEDLVLPTIEGATVMVSVSEQVATAVLVAPAAALVRTDTAGYGVQVVSDGEITTVPVAIGETANRMVEISGEGLTQGMLLVAP